MTGDVTRKDLATFFSNAAFEKKDPDYDGLYEFFKQLSDDGFLQLPKIRLKDRDARDHVAEDLATRVMNLVQAATGRKLKDIDGHARDIAACELGEIKKDEDLPYAFMETCKSAWDHALGSIGIDHEIGAAEFYYGLPKVKLIPASELNLL